MESVTTIDTQDVNILTLPRDVIIPIFHFLPKLEVLHNIRLTCKTWNHYSRDGLLWRRIRAQDYIHDTHRIEHFIEFLCDISNSVEELEIDIEHIENFQNKQILFPRLRSLKLNTFHGFESPYNEYDNSLKAITRMYPDLVTLHLKIEYTDFDMTSCPKDLKELVVDCWYIEEILTYKNHINVGEHFNNLTHLGLLWCSLDNRTVLALLSGLQCLESIDLSYTSVYNEYSEYLTDDEKIPDKPCSKRIQKVVLKNTHHMFFPHVFIYILVSAHGRIRYIDICNSHQRTLTSLCLNKIAEKCKQLDTLIIGNYEEHDQDMSPDQDKNEINRGLRYVASNNKHLSTIKMNFVEGIIDDATVLHVFQNCSKLERIEILGCESLSDNTLGNIASGERLRVMKISKCQLVTPAGIGKALERCSRLRTLHIEDIGTIQLIVDRQSCPLMNCLTFLSLDNCYELSDECLDQISKSCPMLRYINITCCLRITDVGFVQLFQQCASIKEIIINDNVEHKIGLTGHAFATVANCQNNLERLTVGRFSKITYEAIHELICKCPNLTEIVFCNTDRYWEFDIVITDSKLDMTPADTKEFTEKLRRELQKLPPENENNNSFAFSAIRLHRGLSRRNKEKLYANCYGESTRPELN